MAQIESMLKQNPTCMQQTLAVIGDKWTPIILSRLIQNPYTFSELEVSIAPITPRVLTARLRKLESEKIVVRKKYCQRPPRYTYQLTAKGSQLHKIIESMAAWGCDNC